MFRGLSTAAALTCLFGLAIAPASAEEVTVDIGKITDQGVGAKIGAVKAYDSDNGLVLSIAIRTLPVGPHGFHVHENGSCDPAEKDGQKVAGLAAGGHYDPAGTGKHAGPSGEGHLGDLPVIYVEAEEGGLETSVKRVKVVPRLKLADIRGKALMIHGGGDNYADEPKPLGGGGARIACGVVP